MAKLICDKCKGKGMYEAKLRDLSGKHSAWDNFGRAAWVTCDQPCCENGMVDIEKLHEWELR